MPQIPSSSLPGGGGGGGYNSNNQQAAQPSKSTNIVPVKGMISVENVLDTDYELSNTSPLDHRSYTNKNRSPTEQTKDYFSRSTTTADKSFNNVSNYCHKVIVIGEEI
jgi:hypothetical protein